ENLKGNRLDNIMIEGDVGEMLKKVESQQ
ncbi:hypothetical protein HNP90_001900, partial [Methanococcus maripaludis]|nr:hypothetical protein [Methanococcus maripaludis]MBA2863000.1 hypothetical protein [Methanococcus maripaludis]